MRVRWYVDKCEPGNLEQLNKYLDLGWEPFAVAPTYFPQPPMELSPGAVYTAPDEFRMAVWLRKAVDK